MSGIDKKRVAVLGYGSQGRAIAQNLHDSGFVVQVGLRDGSKSANIVVSDGLLPAKSIADAVAKSDVITFALPDHSHRLIHESEVRSNLKSGATLLFLHGLSIHFGLVKPPPNCDVIMIAPHAPGVAVREKYLTDKSLSAFFAVHQDFTGEASKTIVQLAAAIGFEKSRLVTSTFEQEAIGDLFGEQVVLCGGLAALIKNGFEVLVSNGIPAENAYLEVAYQLDLIVDLIKKHGIEGMLKHISVAARLGAVETGPRIINADVRAEMERVADSIRSGEFARKLDSLTPVEIENLNRSTAGLSNEGFEAAVRKFNK